MGPCLVEEDDRRGIVEATAGIGGAEDMIAGLCYGEPREMNSRNIIDGMKNKPRDEPQLVVPQQTNPTSSSGETSSSSS